MLYKNRLLFICIFFCFTSAICKAKDSTLIFRTSVGISYTHLRMQQDDYKYYYGYWEDSILKVGDAMGFSPSIKIGIRKLFNKKVGLDIDLSYSYSKIEYKTSSSFSSPNPPPASGVGSFDAHHTTNQNNTRCDAIALSIGPAFFYRKAYFVPQLGVNYLIYNTKTKQTEQIDTWWTSGSAGHAHSTSFSQISFSTKENIIHLSGGLTIGTNLNIKKVNAFIEIGGNFQNDNRKTVKNLFSTFLAFGIRL